MFRNMKAFSATLFLLLGIASTSAGAAVILNGSTQIQALSLSESFEDFYGFDTTVTGSSSSGFEQNDVMVLFVTEYLGDYALIGIVDGTSETGDTTGGSLDFSLTTNSLPLGSLILADDAADLDSQTASQYVFSFAFGAGRNDGLIYSLEDGLDFDILFDFVFSPKVTDAIFLSFDGPGAPTSYVLGSSATLSESTVVTSVSAPSSLLMFGMFIIALVSFNRKTF